MLLLQMLSFFDQIFLITIFGSLLGFSFELFIDGLEMDVSIGRRVRLEQSQVGLLLWP